MATVAPAASAPRISVVPSMNAMALLASTTDPSHRCAAHAMRFASAAAVPTTPFGVPVEPDV
ncbi:Uncharacterised protein [Mycobacteroides abscessus subsp. abscessus]|nr:Uncharacterised protein [Mycobacteroides abscessus subsp. abscessus]